MARLYELKNTLTPIIGLHGSTVDRTCRKLQDAGLLPASVAACVEPEHAARLLAALLAARAPSEAVEALAAYADLPMTLAQRYREGPDGTSRGETVRVEDIPVLPGYGPTFVEIARSFVGALSCLIEHARHSPLPEGALPVSIAVRRSLAAPVASMNAIVPCAPGWTCRYVYGRGDERGGLYALENIRMAVWAHLPGSVLQEIGDLLAGRAAPAAAEAKASTREPVCHGD